MVDIRIIVQAPHHPSTVVHLAFPRSRIRETAPALPSLFTFTW
jgi:hypothetical protein